MRRGGHTLLEMLAVVPAVGALGLAAAAIWGIALREAPRTVRAMDAHRTLCYAVDRMREDLGSSDGAPVVQNQTPADQRLVIPTSGGFVVWRMTDGAVVRRPLRSDGTPAGPAERLKAPDATLRFVPHRRAGRTVGVEIRTAIEQDHEGVTLRRLPRTVVLFAPGGQGGGE